MASPARYSGIAEADDECNLAVFLRFGYREASCDDRYRFGSCVASTPVLNVGNQLGILG